MFRLYPEFRRATAGPRASNRKKGKNRALPRRKDHTNSQPVGLRDDGAGKNIELWYLIYGVTFGI